MADKNKEDYREYAKLVLTEMYERTEDNLDYGDWLEGMIRHQMMLNNSTDRSLGYEEVVCVASELMLANEPILKGIARGNLFTKLIQWLEMFRDKIKKLFEGTDFADNRFAKATMETVESWYNSLYNTSLVENTENGKTKYSISEESEKNFRNRNYIENNVKIVANMDSVATIKNISGLFKRNTELNSAKNTLKNIFLNFKNPLFNKEIGEVYANGKSANDIISHKVTLTKLMVATKLPILVEKGKVVDYSLMKDGKTKKGNQRYAHRVVLACPITIADTEYKGKYLVGIVVKIKENNKVYLEEVVEIKMENALPLKQTTFSNNMLTNGESDSPSVIKILQNILSVKFDNKSVKKSVADSEGNKLTKEQIDYFKDSKVRDENGDLLVMYHGTARGDRVGYVFREDRATSGPMAFFTDNSKIAENYSKDKSDTSLDYDEDYDSYETQFKVTTKMGDKPVHKLWGYIPMNKRGKIQKLAGQLREDWEGEGDGEYILDETNKEANGGFQWQLKEARGNVIRALEENWLNGGTLFNEEEKFLTILKMTGITDELKNLFGNEPYYKDKYYREEKVYSTYLNITNPFVATEMVTEDFIEDYVEWESENYYPKKDAMSDFWDKNNVDAETFAKRLSDDIKRGTTRAWSSIPDSMTDYLKSLGYDGIQDAGGKHGGEGHTVYIPFYSEQIKDITNKKPTSNVDIRYSKSDEYVNFSEFEKYDIIDYNIPKEFRNAKIKNADLQYEEFESVRSTIFKNNVERERNGEGLTYSSVAYTGMHSFDYHNYSLTDFTVKVIKTLEEENAYDNKTTQDCIDNIADRFGDARRNSKRASKLFGNRGTSRGNDNLSSNRRAKNGNGSNLENGRDNRDRRLRYSMSDEVSDREILSSALMDITTTADEKNVLLNYKRAIGKLEEAEKKLAEYNLKKREAFLKGNKEELKKYTALASKEQNTLDWWDKRLLSLQNTRSLKRLLNSERQKAKKKQENKFKTLIADYKKEIRTKEETAKIKNYISNKVKRINKLIINEQDNKNVKQGIKPLVVDFVRIFLNDNSVFTNSQLNKLISVYDGLYRNLTGEDYTADFEAMGLYDIDFKNEVLRLQETIDGKSLNQLTTDELKVVKDIVDEIDFLIKSENALFDDYRKRSVGQVANEITREINFEKQTNKAQDLERKIRYANTTPIYFFKHLGKTMLGLYDKFRDGQDKNTILVNENQKWMENTKERFNYKVWSEDKFVAPNDSKTLKQLEKYGLTVEQALSIYATYKREQIVGTHHIDEGGITFKENKGVLAKGKNVSHKVVLTLNDVQAITNSLTYEQLAYADEVVNYLSHDMAELGNEVSMSLFGIKKFNENYYFPMASDANFMYQDINNEVRSDSRIVHKSFTKPLTANSNNPIEIFDFTDVAVNHINGMITYYSFAVPLTNFNRVMNHKTEDGTYDVRKAVEGAYGKEALNYINQFLVDLNGGIRSDSSEKLVNQLISRFKSQAVLASMSVVVQQPSSIGRAFALIDGKYFLNSRIKKGSYQECIKYAPIARLKQIGSFDTSLLM